MEEKYQEFINQPYFKIHKPPTYEEWMLMQDQGEIKLSDFKGDGKTPELRNKDYWHWWKGAKDRHNTSMSNETNPYFGVNNAIVPAVSIAMGIQGIRGIPQLYNIVKTPNGMTHLFKKAAIPTILGGIGATVGYNIDQSLGGTGAVGGLYGGWVGTNYANLGRYTLNNLNPRGYNWKDIETWKALGNTYTEPLYKTPPTFFNSRPKWYKGGIPDESRFQNGAIWARIPEEEVQRTLIKKNADGITYRPTREAIEGNQYGSAGVRRDLELHKPETINQAKQEGKIVAQDVLSTVGGEHSDYYLTGETPQGVVWMQKDVQQLNPQWELTDPIKRLFPEGSKMYNIMHKLGGINLSRILGYKPFTYKVGIATTKEGVKPEATIFFDPTNEYIIPE